MELEMDNLKNRGGYQAYMVRFWSDSLGTGWRASAIRVETDEAFHFASPEKLFQFLREQVALTAENKE